MNRSLPAIMLMLTTVCGLAMADTRPAQPIGPTDRASESSRPASKPVTAPQSVAVKTWKAEKTTATKADGPGYTQVGGKIILHLDREQTELKLYENSAYIVVAKRDDIVAVLSSNRRLIDIEETDRNAIAFRTLKPGGGGRKKFYKLSQLHQQGFETALPAHLDGKENVSPI